MKQGNHSKRYGYNANNEHVRNIIWENKAIYSFASISNKTTTIKKDKKEIKAMRFHLAYLKYGYKKGGNSINSNSINGKALIETCAHKPHAAVWRIQSIAQWIDDIPNTDFCVHKNAGTHFFYPKTKKKKKQTDFVYGKAWRHSD